MSVVLGASALLAGSAVTAPASGAIKIYDTSEEASLLGKIERGKCRVRQRERYFLATARSTNRDYGLSVSIYDWKGYRTDYDFRYGTNDPGSFLLVGGGVFTNLNAPPGTGGLPSGGVGFSRGGRRMSVGFLPTPNDSLRKGVVLAGAMRCRD